MPRLGDVALKVRSKNAGPFWLTVDVFCGTRDAYGRVCAGLTKDRLAKVVSLEPDQLKWFELPDLKVIKISFPRPVVQGAKEDRDMHGAAIAALIQELDLN